MSQDSRVCLVTGARTGIGNYLSKHVVEQGYRVIGCSRNPPSWEPEGYTA